MPSDTRIREAIYDLTGLTTEQIFAEIKKYQHENKQNPRKVIVPMKFYLGGVQLQLGFSTGFLFITERSKNENEPPPKRAG